LIGLGKSRDGIVGGGVPLSSDPISQLRRRRARPE
jgi:hypothetical protein